MLSRSLFLSFVILLTVTSTVAANDRIQPRIVGGIEAPRGAYPFVAALLRTGAGSVYDRQFCGGTLIHPRWIATAAHCVTDNGVVTTPSLLQVGLGLHNLVTDSAEIHNIKKIVVHPNFNSTTQDSDIALLLLDTATSYQPIWYTPSLASTGTLVRAIGWGSTSATSTPNYPEALQQVDVPVVSNATCQSSYNSVGDTITANMFCAGYQQGGKDSCQGDSGGPVVVYSSGAWWLHGIVSWGEGCAQPSFYGIYTRVPNFGSFIETYVIDQPGDASVGKWALWNGYLGMVNIAEIANNTSSAQTFSLYLQDDQGTVLSAVSYTLPAGRQQDIVLNDLFGFTTEAYGAVRIIGSVSARVIRYRPVNGTGFSNFEFALANQFSSAFTQPERVPFNSYTLDQREVANYLSLINLSDSPINFIVNRYDEAGNLLHNGGTPLTTYLPLGAWGRQDIEAGHLLPGPNNVGLLEITTSPSGAPYLAQLNRYGYRFDNSLMFGVTLQPKSGSEGTFALPMSTSLNALNWLELVTNRAQNHVSVNTAYGDNFIGSYTASGVAESMFYLRTADNSNIMTAYADQGAPISSTIKSASYNLFLGMENWLELSSHSGSSTTASATARSFSGTIKSISVGLGPNETKSIPLHAGDFQMPQDTYGTVSVGSTGSFSGRVLRLKKNGGITEFILPTSLE